MSNDKTSWKIPKPTQSIILTIGIPASGKDTWAFEQWMDDPTIWITNRDDLRAMHHTQSHSIHQYKYTKAKERDVTDRQLDGAKAALERGNSVIVSDTNLNPKTRTVWARLANEMGVPLHYKVMDTPLATCIKRNAKRAEYVPESVLIRMEQAMRKYQGKYFHDRSNPDKLPECVIFDIDGTLADMTGVRGPFEWDKVGLDKPREFVCEYLRMLEREDYFQIVVFSGRDGACELETRQWLHEQGLNFDLLAMRAAGDDRPDTIVKEEMFDKYIKGKYHVNHVVDDRKAVCQLYESMNFEVMNVGGYLANF